MEALARSVQLQEHRLRPACACGFPLPQKSADVSPLLVKGQGRTPANPSTGPTGGHAVLLMARKSTEEQPSALQLYAQVLEPASVLQSYLPSVPDLQAFHSFLIQK